MEKSKRLMVTGSLDANPMIFRLAIIDNFSFFFLFSWQWSAKIVVRAFPKQQKTWLNQQSGYYFDEKNC